MATATTRTADVTYVLELNEAEALYVHAALLHATPGKNSPIYDDGSQDDPVYEAIHDALTEIKGGQFTSAGHAITGASV